VSPTVGNISQQTIEDIKRVCFVFYSWALYVHINLFVSLFIYEYSSISVYVFTLIYRIQQIKLKSFVHTSIKVFCERNKLHDIQFLCSILFLIYVSHLTESI
jgi:hypothetical protein